MAIVGLGMDICSVERIQRILQGPRGERFLERVYTDAERALCRQRADAASAYAARFAAKEALEEVEVGAYQETGYVASPDEEPPSREGTPAEPAAVEPVAPAEAPESPPAQEQQNTAE